MRCTVASDIASPTFNGNATSLAEDCTKFVVKHSPLRSACYNVCFVCQAAHHLCHTCWICQLVKPFASACTVLATETSEHAVPF